MFIQALVGVGAALAIGGSALAGIDFPPPWTGTGITGNPTHWRWDFIPTPTGGVTDPVGNGPGTPTIVPGTWQWSPTTPSGMGTGVLVIPPGGTIEILVPNFPQPNDFKLIWIQYHWYGTGAEPVTNVLVPGIPGVIATPYGPTVTPSPGPGGGLFGGHGWRLPFNPPFETITLMNPDPNNPMYLEWLTIDTLCAPSPGAAAALAGAGLLAVGRRRR